MSKPVIISAAITGGMTSRSDHPRLPITPREIAFAAAESVEEGAAIVDLHVREADGTPSPRLEFYEEAISMIRDRVDCVINVSTGSGGGRFTVAQRMAPLKLGPEIATFDCGSMNFGERVFENSPEFLRRLATEMADRNILPEIECFDVGMIGNALKLGENGLLPGPGKWWFQFCFGIKGGVPLDLTTLSAMIGLLPPNSEWSILGVGASQLRANMLGLAMGGHVRTGFEDNVYFKKGELAESNAQLVSRLVNLASDLSRPVASPDMARRLLGIDGVTPIAGP